MQRLLWWQHVKHVAFSNQTMYKWFSGECFSSLASQLTKLQFLLHSTDWKLNLEPESLWLQVSQFVVHPSSNKENYPTVAGFRYSWALVIVCLTTVFEIGMQLSLAAIFTHCIQHLGHQFNICSTLQCTEAAQVTDNCVVTCQQAVKLWYGEACILRQLEILKPSFQGS